MNLNTFLRRVVLAGVFAALFVPLVVSTDLLFPFIAGKNFAFRIIVEIILSAWALLAIRDAPYRPKKSMILWAFAIFVGVLALADFFGENPYRSFWSNYERMEGLIGHLHLLAYFLVATSALATEKLWHRFFYTSFGVNAAIIFFSFFQLAGSLAINQGGVRVDATFGNATYLATYLLFNVFLLAFYLFRSYETNGGDEDKGIRATLAILGIGLGSLIAAYAAKVPSYGYFLIIAAVLLAYYPLSLSLRLYSGKIFLWLLLLADLFVLFRTETRGDILGLLGGLGAAALLLAIFNWKNKQVRSWSVGVIVALVIFIGLFVALKDSSFIRNNSTLARFASISLTEQTTVSRFTIWNMSWQGFKERPILGWGQENFIVVFSKYYTPEMWNQEPWFDRSHNVFFDWMIAGGSLGILSYLALFGAGLYTLWRSRKFSLTDKSVLTGLLVGYFFQNLFVFDNLTSYLMFFSVLGFVSVAGHMGGGEDIHVHKENKEDKESLDNATYIAGPVILLAFIGIIYYANARPIIA
ncbi:MAG: O-antigen ligase family protein, partial [Candidatus Paceibacterota bacterium]